MNKSVAVKICGITNVSDAIAAASAGADMLGFNFYERSARFVDRVQAAAMIAQVRGTWPGVRCVGVFVDATPVAIRELVAEMGLDAAQLHGNETPEYCGALSGICVIKALRVTRGFDPAQVRRFDCDTILLDTWHPGYFGGTGERFDWSVAADIRQRVERLILAGGLDAGNVAAAVREVRPDAVDVCSGIEDTPGRKNPAKIREFIAAVRNATVSAEVGP